MAASGFDNSQLALTIMSAALRMVTAERFHCDLHPGNILALTDGRIAILDFGACGTISARARDGLTRLLVAIATHNAQDLTQGILCLAAPSGQFDDRALSAQLTELIFPLASSSLGSISLGRTLLDLMAVMQAHRLRLHPDVALLVKAIVTVEATARPRPWRLLRPCAHGSSRSLRTGPYHDRLDLREMSSSRPRPALDRQDAPLPAPTGARLRLAPGFELAAVE